MTSLAAHLGVDHSSLYRHVKSHSEIIALASDLAIDELDWRAAEGASWREELIALTDGVWALYERHPGLAEAFRSVEFAPQAGIRSFAEAVARLRNHGFSLEESMLAVDTLVDMAGDCFLGWRAMARPDREGRAHTASIIETWKEAAKNHTEDAAAIQGMVAVIEGGARPWWERKRDLVLAGLAAMRSSNSDDPY
ncbi:TetR family transcriptional regulator [Nitratireductor pacificus pht-3B]|uniref:TetR family transcriptional regulator n=1 Tax=Nitratireductor pacificus pht-3B TaxID=391937 RepID=K2LIH5_9HYPH|nr:TetR family transcriptional regulator [Nitratireductor pacificus pht-3B]